MTRVTQEDAVAIARRLYGLAAAARPLPSERDQNFALATERGAFVLKISGTAEKREVLELQNDVLGRLEPILRILRKQLHDNAFERTWDRHLKLRWFLRLDLPNPRDFLN